MKNGSKILIVIIAVLVSIGIWIGASYNSLVSLDQNVDTAEANIATQLQRRSDLIPNLVSTVKGYAGQEKEIFTEIADARARLAGANTITEEANADSALSSSLSRLLAIAENYPQLQSSQNFQDLSIQLEGTENRIAIARQDYNETVKLYNAKRRRFPSNIIGSLFNFDERPYYEASSGAETVPTVDFTT